MIQQRFWLRVHGSALQAVLVSSINDSESELREAFSRETKMNKALFTRWRAKNWEELGYRPLNNRRLFRRERPVLPAESFLSI